jgi:hypothetical protein
LPEHRPQHRAIEAAYFASTVSAKLGQWGAAAETVAITHALRKKSWQLAAGSLTRLLLVFGEDRGWSQTVCYLADTYCTFRNISMHRA